MERDLHCYVRSPKWNDNLNSTIMNYSNLKSWHSISVCNLWIDPSFPTSFEFTFKLQDKKWNSFKIKGSNLSTIMSVKSSDMMSNSKTAICTKPPKFEKCQQRNLTPKKQGLWVTSPNKHPGVFTTLASPAAARASASAAFKTAGWAGSLGVFQKSGEKTSWGWCVFIPLFTYRFKNMLGGCLGNSEPTVCRSNMFLYWKFFIDSLPQKHSCHCWCSKKYMH